MAKEFDVVVIGAGPGGYVSAIRAAQLGFKVAVVEKEYLGGVCLNVGCIPSKAMISAASYLYKSQNSFSTMGFEIEGGVKVNHEKLQSWKQSVCDKMSGGVKQLLKGNKVEIIMGEASFVNKNEIKVSGESIRSKYFVVAAGSRPVQIPGFEYDEENVLSSTGGLAQKESLKSLLVIGGGYIGLEIGIFMAKLGTKVTIIEAGNALLSGLVEKDILQVLQRKLKKLGINVITNAKAKAYKKGKAGLTLSVDVDGKDENFDGEKILVTVGRKANSDLINVKDIGVQIDDNGFIVVDKQMRTNIENIFAIGDIVGQPMLAHKASHEGVIAAEVIAGKNRVFDAKTIPAVIFTDPEIAYCGMTEEEAKAEFGEILVAKFPFGANGKAVSMLETDGFVKYIADKKDHILRGVHICGPQASNLISEAVLAIEMGARLEDIALSIHPHPSLGETMMEAAEATLGHAIHIL